MYIFILHISFFIDKEPKQSTDTFFQTLGIHRHPRNPVATCLTYIKNTQRSKNRDDSSLNYFIAVKFARGRRMGTNSLGIKVTYIYM